MPETNGGGERAPAREEQHQPWTVGNGSFEVPPIVFDNLPVERLGRRTMRAEIVGFNPQPDPPGKWSATLEVYNLLTGHTRLLLGLPDALPRTPAVIGPSGAVN